MNRLQLRAGVLAIETENTESGRAYLEGLRKLRPRLFRRGRIRSILQLGYMSIGVVYVVGGPVLGEPWKVSDNPFASEGGGA